MWAFFSLELHIEMKQSNTVLWGQYKISLGHTRRQQTVFVELVVDLTFQLLVENELKMTCLLHCQRLVQVSQWVGLKLFTKPLLLLRPKTADINFWYYICSWPSSLVWCSFLASLSAKVSAKLSLPYSFFAQSGLSDSILKKVSVS